jgi:SAM-dependent methyltransferase
MLRTMVSLPTKNRSIVSYLTKIESRILRKQSCRLCGAKEAYPIGDITFWDIEQSVLVACSNCRLVQLDPMISDRGMAKGVYAYYLWQHGHESQRSQLRNAARNFRKGYAFAKSLPARFTPQRILELGPGSGWFLRGVKQTFPEAQYFAWDIVPDVAKSMAELHGFEPVSGEISALQGNKQYDLIIVRDVIEHFADAAAALTKIAALLAPGGFFHFITPNGHEDLWKFYVAKRLGKSFPSELLLNHVNYFDGGGLKQFLTTLGLKAYRYYAYDFSAWRSGIGWRVAPDLAAGSHGLKADNTITEYTVKVPQQARIDLPKLTWYRKIWYRWKGWHILRLDPRRNFGHEFFGIFYKP